MKISIITPTYNRGKMLIDLYESILLNLNSNVELQWIIVDDGSTDNTEEVVKSFSGLDIKYYYQQNSGKMAALNNGIKECNRRFNYRN